MPELRVMSFNLRNARANDGPNHWTHRRAFVADSIRASAADLVGVQEGYRDQLDELLAALPEFGEVGVGRDDGVSLGEHSQILYLRDRFGIAEHGTFWFSDTPDVPGSVSWGNRITRMCTWARLHERMSGRFLYFYNLHLDHESQPSRERSVELLLRRIRQRDHSDPVLVTGDFNAGEENPAIRALSVTPELYDTFRALHPDETEVSTFHGFSGGTAGEKIDFIFASREFQILAAAILRDSRGGRYPSDHYPVAATLSL